ncbi:MAG TPA: ferredoxin [Candidatus Nanoarchaeia archaeon]|nr:ferredoxin [Candidatus Nanoarchaeia archaeon]
MAKYKITLGRETCIGAASCVACAEDFWKLVDDSKVDIIGGARENGNKIQTIVIEEKDFEKNLEAAKSCPVNAIHIKNLQTGKDEI